VRKRENAKTTGGASRRLQARKRENDFYALFMPMEQAYAKTTGGRKLFYALFMPIEQAYAPTQRVESIVDFFSFFTAKSSTRLLLSSATE
jgi:DNA anti-recombination protein RmuC